MQRSGKEEKTCIYCGLPGEKEYWDYYYQEKGGSLKPIREYECPRCKSSFYLKRSS